MDFSFILVNHEESAEMRVNYLYYLIKLLQ